GPTGQGTADLCGIKGNPKEFACNKEIDIPIWNKFDGHKEVQVKYVGKFVVTGFLDAGGKGSDAQVIGYLTAKESDGGGFSGNPGPIQAVALVH
ncbi:MAG TPA: hypothetical protein VHQ45_19905, partial [Gemmatimonadaceae bacterium]|nr:hypothetical protein [Gemmatimonadaceae bacterium]